MLKLQRCLALMIFCLVWLTTSIRAEQVLLGEDLALKGSHGAVASESSRCSQIGIDLMKAGGNAADAMVGTTFCVGVIGMYHSGIGGGGFALVRAANGSEEVVDFRESAPAAAFEHMYKDNVNGSLRGGLASGVPGELRGLQYIQEQYGALPWPMVLEPATSVARNGFPVSHDLVRGMEFATREYDFLTKDPTWAIDFAPNGTKLGFGDIMTRKRYATTLEVIARDGPNVLYTGKMGEAIIAALKESNGTMTMQDLKDYEAVSRPAVTIDFHGYHVAGCGSPASGAVALSVLKTVEGYVDFGCPENTNISAHRLVEAMRFAYGKRASLGDPDFVDDMHVFESDMMNDTYAAAVRSKISDSHTLNVSAYNPDGFESHDSHGTSHIVTADSSGLAISLTTTINLFFGSQIMVPETGVIMNNEMNDFSIPRVRNEFGYVPSPANYIRPRKRPVSSITPLIASHPNGSLFAVLGAAGGSRIITATIQNAVDVLNRNLTAHKALEKPRLHDQLIPNEVTLEWAYENGTPDFLKSRNHAVRWVPPGYSSSQAIRAQRDGTFEAAGEPRQSDSAGLVF